MAQMFIILEKFHLDQADNGTLPVYLPPDVASLLAVSLPVWTEFLVKDHQLHTRNLFEQNCLKQFCNPCSLGHVSKLQFLLRCFVFSLLYSHYSLLCGCRISLFST